MTSYAERITTALLAAPEGLTMSRLVQAIGEREPSEAFLEALTMLVGTWQVVLLWRDGVRVYRWKPERAA